jgi:hypothetical protein
MKYAGLCIGGPDAGNSRASLKSRWEVFKTPFHTMNDLRIAEKMMPDMEIPVQLLGHYVWDAVNQVWRWEKVE